MNKPKADHAFDDATVPVVVQHDRAEDLPMEQVRTPEGTTIIYSQVVADRICEYLMQGYSLKHSCRQEDIPISIRTAHNWLGYGGRGVKPFDRFYWARRVAMEIAAEDVFEEMKDIERCMKAPKLIDHPDMLTEGGSPAKVLNPHWIDSMAGRAIIDSLKWRAARMAPREYGDAKDRELAIRQDEQKQGDTKTKMTDVIPDWMAEAIRTRKT